MQIFVIYTNLGLTSQETDYVPAAKPKRLMLFRETVMFIVRITWNVQLYCVGSVTVGGTYSYHCDVQSYVHGMVSALLAKYYLDKELKVDWTSEVCGTPERHESQTEF
jgi:hypothetical protein